MENLEKNRNAISAGIYHYEIPIQSDWAAWQLGLQCKRTSMGLRKIFRWDLLGNIERRSKNILRLGYLAIKRLPGWSRSLGVIPGLVAEIQLRKAQTRKDGVFRIWCGWKRRLVLRNGSTDLNVFEQHFLRREILDIDFPKNNISTILDLGANIGVSVEVFNRLFPKANIIAIELEKENMEMCRINHGDNRNVSMINGAIWSETGRVGLQDVGDGSWAFQVDDKQDYNTVPAYTYSDILEIHNIERIDIMKMDIEGAEAAVLEASADEIFSTTTISIIEVHNWIDGIEERVSEVIKKCKDKYSLDISHNGELLIVKNMDLLCK